MRRRGYFLETLIFLLVLLVVTQVFLPGLAEKKIKEAFKQRVDGVESLRVNLGAFPALKLVIKRADWVEVRGTNLIVNNLPVTSFKSYIEDVRVTDGEIRGSNTDLNIKITEEDINKFIQKNYPSLNNFTIKLLPGQVFMSGKVGFINIKLTGKFQVAKVNRVSFVPTGIQIEELQLSSEAIAEVINDKEFSFDFRGLGLPVKVEEVLIKSGEVEINGGKSVRKAVSSWKD
ncbi:LmeA family phospholipid-binding protein [Halothermothrix orenii]|uniref:DUF2993 domain-containing protein n=1 Tax=Halothermothrix orenii (strain H 168 / OCM 544 / DSM 9562) TaxID=373903 RepID=B8CYM2_HALOH|nr:DUF2993 domain-containing protein [Halothermothrix orenii]ACL70391.1 hypothetical protein Hore_16420 [Halothermothrix orenii H 168]